MGKYTNIQELKNYINEYMIKPILICFGINHQKANRKIKCEWLACANNASGICNCKSVNLKNDDINGVNYLRCESFDFE